MSLNEWRVKFQNLYNSGVRKVILIGGEPTMRMEVIYLAQEIFFGTIVITNGLIKIPDEYNGLIIISLEGMNEVNDAIRG